MGDDAHRPFHCPSQECQRDQGDLDFGDAKRFYLHWVSTHKPRCPRTNCKYSLQDLSKSTESYFLRHWSSHFPDLNTGKSACGKCGRKFANTNNRDRHAAKCEGNAAESNQTITEATANDLEPELVANLTGFATPNLGLEGWPGTNAHWDLINDLSYDAGPSHLGECMSSWARLSEPSLDQATTVQALSLQPTNPTVNPEYDYASFEQKLASPLPHHPSLELAVDQYVMSQCEDTNALSSSRNRAIEDTAIHISKRHQSIMDGVGNLIENHSDFDPYTQTAEPGEVLLAEPPERDAHRESDVALESMVLVSQAHTSTSVAVTNGVDALTAPATSMTTLPLRPFKRYTLLERSYHCSQCSKAENIEVHKKTAAVKTLVRSTSCFQASSYDHYTWIRKLTRKHRKITDATSLLVNDILVSKRTRYPRIIDDKSPIFELCATGNYDEVNRLLSLGKATIVDVDSGGMTLLHWAAAHWQFHICQLLLAKGADVEARNWVGIYVPVTPLGIACCSGDYRQFAFTNFRPKHATDTLDLLLESGLDTHVSVEIDYNLHHLGESMTRSMVPPSIRRTFAQQFAWLMRKYIKATTCGGLLSCTELHAEACAAIKQSTICFAGSDKSWDEERFDYGVFAYMGIQACQSFWLSLIAAATVCGEILPEISPQLCRAYAGDFHYQQSWDVHGHTGRDSPMQLALRSFAALGTFHSILTASGTDIVKFTEKESTMPWCNHSHETLISFFSLQHQEYSYFISLFSTPSMCYDCGCEFQHEGFTNWEEAVELVRSGRSLASLLEYPSEEERYILDLSMDHCETCRFDMHASSESDESEDGQTENDNEHIGIIEGDVEGDGDPLSDERISGMEFERMEEGTDADSSDESSSDEDSGECGEQIEWDQSYT